MALMLCTPLLARWARYAFSIALASTPLASVAGVEGCEGVGEVVGTVVCCTAPAEALPVSHECSTSSRGAEDATSPGAGAWVQTCQFALTTTPNVPPPEIVSLAGSMPAR